MRIWLITDGKAGDINPCLGVAERYAQQIDGPVDIESGVVNPRKPWTWLMPWGPIDPKDRLDIAQSPLAPPFPDIAIASGRRSVPYLRALKRATPQCFTVFLKDSKTGCSTADFIWVPSHDRLRGSNVLHTPTGPHRLSPQVLRQHSEQAAEQLLALPEPRVAVLIGGPAKHTAFSEQDVLDLQTQLQHAASQAGSLMLVASRRTPPHWEPVLQAALHSRPGFFWRSESDGPNPYLDVLSLADVIIVTGDSHNMVSEALASGAPVYVFTPQKLAAKLNRFVDTLVHEQLACRLTKDRQTRLEFTRRNPIDSTQTIAQEIHNRYINKNKT